jgi:hypothetical protein
MPASYSSIERFIDQNQRPDGVHLNLKLSVTPYVAGIPA